MLNLWMKLALEYFIPQPLKTDLALYFLVTRIHTWIFIILFENQYFMIINPMATYPWSAICFHINIQFLVGTDILVFSNISRQALGPTQSPIKLVPEALSPGVSGRSMTQTTYLYLLPRLKTCEPIHPLTHTSSWHCT
jgi:hypothetical protein